MTRQEFIQNVTTWRELLNFCWEYDCNVCENIIPHDELRDYIAEDFRQYAYEYSWVDIRDWLNNIDNNASFYYRDGSFDYTSVDDDFASYKQDVLDWCDEDASVFDEDEDEADTTTHIFDPFEDNILDLDDDYLIVAVESDTGSGKVDDDELQDDEHSPEEILELLMTHFQYTKTE